MIFLLHFQFSLMFNSCDFTSLFDICFILSGIGRHSEVGNVVMKIVVIFYGLSPSLQFLNNIHKSTFQLL